MIRRIANVEPLAMMTHIGEEELNTLYSDMTPIMSSTDRALLTMTALGCKEVEYYEQVHPCIRRV